MGTIGSDATTVMELGTVPYSTVCARVESVAVSVSSHVLTMKGKLQCVEGMARAKDAKY